MLFDMSDIKPSVLSFLMVGIMAMIFILLMKFVVNTYKNPVTDMLRETVNTI